MLCIATRRSERVTNSDSFRHKSSLTTQRQTTRQTGRQTDGQTDGQLVALHGRTRKPGDSITDAVRAITAYTRSVASCVKKTWGEGSRKFQFCDRQLQIDSNVSIKTINTKLSCCCDSRSYCQRHSLRLITDVEQNVFALAAQSDSTC